MAELAVFAAFFGAYAVTRLNNLELFNHYQLTLDRQAALVNTLALITSSYFVVWVFGGDPPGRLGGLRPLATGGAGAGGPVPGGQILRIQPSPGPGIPG